MSFPGYTPIINPNPYPAPGWRKMTDFEFTRDLYIARAKEPILGVKREQQYVVSAQYNCRMKVDGAPREIAVPSGMLTDLTSVPWGARNLVGRVGRHLEAAIVHDFLFVAWQDLDGATPTQTNFRFANEVMLQAMIAAGVG